MADAKSSINDRAGRQKILEGLWLIGIEPAQLNVSPDLDGNAFLAALHQNGVNDTFVGRAMAGVDWRQDGGTTLSQNIMSLLRASGYRTDEVQRFYDEVVQRGAGNDPGRLMTGLTTLFGDRTAGAMLYKATGGKAPSGAVWNPFRTDAPPAGVDTRYGGGGILATNLPPGMTSAEPANRFAQPGSPNPAVPTSATSGVPTPPQSVRATPTQAPGAPTISGQTPGAGGPAPGTAGGPGAGGTPQSEKQLTPAERRANLEAMYGWAAVFLDDPEVAKIVNDVASGAISETQANRQWLNSNFYKTTSAAERAWRTLEKSDPADARMQMEGQVTSIASRANGLGIDLDPARARQIAEMSKRFGWSDQQIAGAIASEAKYDPSGAKTGVLAQIKGAQQSQLVPMSDQAMTSWAQAIIGGSQTMDDFNAYLKDQAKSLFPSMAGWLDRTPGGTVATYLDPYSQQISKTLGMPAGDIDWTDPKWFRFVNQVDPKTGERSVMDIADVSRTVITDSQYGYDQTANGKQAKAGLAKTILQQWGFMAPTGNGAGGFG